MFVSVPCCGYPIQYICKQICNFVNKATETYQNKNNFPSLFSSSEILPRESSALGGNKLIMSNRPQHRLSTNVHDV